MQKRFEENVAGVVAAVKDRELRAQMEKTARRKLQDVRGAAKEELNSAVVQTISSRSRILGIRLETLDKVGVENLQPGVKVRVRGFASL